MNKCCLNVAFICVAAEVVERAQLIPQPVAHPVSRAPVAVTSAGGGNLSVSDILKVLVQQVTQTLVVFK